MEYTREEVSKHNTVESIWVIINEDVLDVTKYLESKIFVSLIFCLELNYKF